MITQPELKGIHTYAFGKIPVDTTLRDNRLVVAVHEEELVDETIQAEIDDNWKSVIESNPQATDGRILFLKDVEEEDGQFCIHAEEAGFSRTAFFNREAENYDREDDLVTSRGLSISTHTHIVGIDGDFLYGSKKNQFHQISGFGKFPGKEDYEEYTVGITLLNPWTTAQAGLEKEIGDAYKSISAISAVGATFVDHEYLRGADIDFYAQIDASTKDIMELFAQRNQDESGQFTKKMYSVRTEPEAVARFFIRVFDDGGVVSPYAMGAQVAIQEAIHGKDAAGLYLHILQEEGIPIHSHTMDSKLTVEELLASR